MRWGQPAVVYLDSNAFIRFIEGKDEGIVFLAERVADDLIQLHTSELTLAEVLVEPMRLKNQALVDLYQRLLVSDHDFLTVTPVSRDILIRSAENRARYRNKTADSVHIATAEAAVCSIFISSDRRLRLPPGMVRMDVDAVADPNAWP